MLRNIAVFVVGVGCVLVVLSKTRRRRVAGRPFVSRRIVDEGERAAQAADAWEGEGGAMQGQPQNT
jgi:hypothetical protein